VITPQASKDAGARPAACFRTYADLEKNGRIATPANQVKVVPQGMAAARVPPRFSPVNGAVVLTHADSDPNHSDGVTEFYVKYTALRPPTVYGPFEAIAGGLKSLPVYYDDGRVSVVSDVPLDDASASSFAARIADAYSFDLERLGWRNPPTLDRLPVRLEALSGPAMRQFYPGFSGAAMGTQLFVMGTPSLTVGGQGIIAHEVSHIQSAREGSGLPHWLEEGKAGVLQRLFMLARGVAFKAPGPFSATITSAAALDILEQSSFGPATVGAASYEPVGLMFAEFIRTRLAKSGTYSPDPGGGDFSDAVRRFARIIERINVVKKQFLSAHPRATWTEVQAKNTFEAAFKLQFAMTIDEAKAQFSAWLDDTQPLVNDAPNTRFVGTILLGGKSA
jgi:hypothetical protein